MTERLDYIEVGRAAHELSDRHGHDAHRYAARLAAQAAADGDLERHEFWRGVEAALTPRSISK